MNVCVLGVGGGVFSKLTIALHYLFFKVPDIFNIENIYLGIDWDSADLSKTVKIDANPYDFVLNQESNFSDFVTYRAKFKKVYTDLFKHPDKKKLSYLANLLQIKPEILNKLPNNLDSDTLGVHFRLTDMPVFHKNYGVFKFDDYVRKIDDVLKVNKNINKIFVASDNVESITKIKKLYGGIVFNLENLKNRAVRETSGEDYNKYLRKNSSSEFLWVESFLEMLSLSKCGYLVHRVSSLSNVSILFSETIQEVYSL